MVAHTYGPSTQEAKTKKIDGAQKLEAGWAAQ